MRTNLPKIRKTTDMVVIPQRKLSPNAYLVRAKLTRQSSRRKRYRCSDIQ